MEFCNFIAALPENRPLWLRVFATFAARGVKPTPATRAWSAAWTRSSAALSSSPMNGLVCSASTRCWASFRWKILAKSASSTHSFLRRIASAAAPRTAS